MQERQRIEYLHAMGIEVWRNKHSLDPVTGTADEEGSVGTSARSQNSRLDMSSELVPAPAASSEAESPASLAGIGLGLIKYHNGLAVFDLPVTGTGLSNGCQQLLDDIVKTLGVATQQRTLIRETEDLWQDGANEALRTRVAQLLGGSNSFLLVFGEAACRLLLGKDVETFTALDWMGRKAVAGKGLDVMLQSPALKRSLWLSLQEHLLRR